MAWVGRTLAEEQTCDRVLFVTFTYGGGYENEDAYWINHKDLQRCFKQMRNGRKKLNQPPLKFRYISVGEYGSEKDRAHFHAMLFIKGEMPNVQLDKLIDDYFAWPHGFVKFEKPRSNQAAAVYIMDYLDKDNLIENNLRFSNVPGLGHEYLMEYARKHAQMGLALFNNGLFYTVPGSTRKNGQPFRYEINPNSSMFSHMVREYVDHWIEWRPNQRIPLSTKMQECLDEFLQDVNVPSHWELYFRENYGDDFHENFYQSIWKGTKLDRKVELSWSDMNVGLIEVTSPKGNDLWYSEFDLGDVADAGLPVTHLPEDAPPREFIDLIERNSRKLIHHLSKRAPRRVQDYIEKNVLRLPGPRS